MLHFTYVKSDCWDLPCDLDPLQNLTGFFFGVLCQYFFHNPADRQTTHVLSKGETEMKGSNKWQNNYEISAKVQHGWIILQAILLSDGQTRSISLWTLNSLQSIDSRTPLQEPSMFSKQTAQPVQESRPGPKEPDTGIASDSCFLLCNYTQLLFLREGILVL